jgi:hypothetical protein
MNILETSATEVAFCNEAYAKTNDACIQEAIEKGGRCQDMLLKILEVLKYEINHHGEGSAMSPTDLLYKIIGLASEYDLPEIREKALDYQEGRSR